MSMDKGAGAEHPSARPAAWTVVAILALALVSGGIVSPARRAVQGKRERVQANARLLSALHAADRNASRNGALPGKALAALSAGRVVQGLTELAHWTEIRRVTFATREVTAIEVGPTRGSARAARLPVTVWLEAPPGAFAIYLDGLDALPWPVRVRSFEMKRAPAAAGGMRIRLDVEVYGLLA